jgi:hypothetical protein
MHQNFVEILSSDIDERRALFSAAASHLETRAENIEKDLYVCWVLDFLFNRRARRPDQPIEDDRVCALWQNWPGACSENTCYRSIGGVTTQSEEDPV